jgi:cellulose synthase/poly-beta-1,6-N-acetylglucosamine synthase-like glycosyltransferase
VIVADNASADGAAEAIAERHPGVRVQRMERNLGFGRAIDRVALALPDGDDAALVLVNDDVECRPDFLARLLAPLADPRVGMVAGVLVQASDPGRIDSAGIELDRGLGSYDLLAGGPLTALRGARDPVGPCGGAAAYRLSAFRAAGGFDPALFAYWEDVDLALRLRAAGWGCVLAREAIAVHHHAQTLGAVSPARRELDQFGRGYLLAKYRVSRGPAARLAVIARDLPTLAATALVRREWATLRARGRGLATGYRREPPLRDPGARFATVGLGDVVRRVWRPALSRTPR